MQGHKDEWIRDRVKWKLAGFDLSSSEVIVFEDDGGAGANLRRIAESRSAGLPIMAFWRSEELWTLLGSEKIVWVRNAGVEELLLDELKWATDHGMADVMQREMEAGAANHVVVRHKRDWETLRLTAKNGNEYLVWTAPGGGCMALWNVLLMLMGMQ